jgi:hypothetical protein
MCPKTLWPATSWPLIWPNFSFEASRIIARLQELYEKTEYVSSNALILETSLTSDMIDTMNKLVELLVEDTTIEQNIKDLIQTEFVAASIGINADLTTLKRFAYNLNEILNG